MAPLTAPFVAPYSTCSTLLFFLLFLVWHTWRCYFSCYSLLDVIVPLVPLCLTLLLLLLAQAPFYYIMMLFLLLLLFLMFKIVLSPFNFLQVWEELSKFKFLSQTWKVRCFFFQSLFVDEFLSIQLFLGNFGWKCVYLLCVGIIWTLYIFFYTLHFICTITLCIF